MTDTIIYQLKQNQDVQTPIGPGVIQGKMVEPDGSLLIIVFHDPRKVQLPEEDLFLLRGGLMVRRFYRPGQLTPLMK